jgi:exonuclease III
MKITKNNYANFFRLILSLSNDIELNPGPPPTYSFKNLFVATYNLRGSKDHNKITRLNKFLNKLPYKGNLLINVQETHINENEFDKLNDLWNRGHVHSNAINNSGGVAILFNKTYFDDVILTKAIPGGRVCYLIATKNQTKYCFINIYAPTNNNEKHKFYNSLEEVLNTISKDHPDGTVFLSGDFNLILDPETDSINRNQNASELKAVNLLKDMMVKHNLIDCYRIHNKYGGYTWGRDRPVYLRSRLDMILASNRIKQEINNSWINYTFNESDHRFMQLELETGDVKFGPGIMRANSSLLENPEIKNRVNAHLINIIKENTNNMNPHEKLDYVKMQLRSLLLLEGKTKAIEEKTILEHSYIEIARLNEALENELTKHSLRKCKQHSTNCYKEIDYYKEALDIAEINIASLREKESKNLIFRSRAQWAEQGEKSNKYFLNLLKDRQKKMQIRKIVSNGKTFYKQSEISKAISNFYKDLYSKQPLQEIDKSDTLFDSLPKLDVEDAAKLKQNITLDELYTTLKTCKESSPGPDGLTYKTYEHLWDTMGPCILSSWNHSCKIGSTSNSQKYSIITLLEKKGKDKTMIENLRPISLSNCDIKICTKAIALRTNKILHKLINETQTGYVRNRQVNDNSRYLEELINHYNKEGKIAYLITLDASKAFDSIDHKYLINLLELYGFPKEYIHWISTLYSGLNAAVLVNGFTSERFNIEQSVKQGDALSCALFILAIEPLLRSIKRNTKIQSVSLTEEKDLVDYINNLSYADDITALCENIEGIQEITIMLL